MYLFLFPRLDQGKVDIRRRFARVLGSQEADSPAQVVRVVESSHVVSRREIAGIVAQSRVEAHEEHSEEANASDDKRNSGRTRFRNTIIFNY